MSSTHSTHSAHSAHSGEPSADAASTASNEPVDLDDSSPHNLHRAVYARRSEYVRPHRMRIKIGTWNVAACGGTDQDLASWFTDGKGVDRRLANLDIPHNRAVEREDTADSLDHDPDAVRLVGGDKIGLYVLGLQEVIPLNVATQYVTRVYTDTGTEVDNRWKDALEAALPHGYKQVCCQRLFGLLLLIYASPEIYPSISNVSTVSTGTGLLGYVGNKGAVSTRLMLGETTRLLFVNSHLASGEDQQYLDRRCWDVAEILKRTQFDPITRPGFEDSEVEKIGDEDFGFWFGDLNFRLDGIPGDDIRHILMLHTKGEYGVNKDSEDTTNGEEPIHLKSVDSGDDRDDDSSESKADKKSGSKTKSDDADDASVELPDPDDFEPDPADDPASLQATLDSLLPHDQLRRTIKDKKAFHDGWREGAITFLPSYKYDVGTVGHFDSSAKRRSPSWCDRILYRTRKDRADYDRKVKEAAAAQKRDEEMKKRGLDEETDNESILFDYDPENDGDDVPPKTTTMYDYDEEEGEAETQAEADDGDETEEVVTKDGFIDRLHLDIYASHQRVQSSDHKPVISILTLDYDAVVPELKAKVHAEVVRELDRAENEGRPEITIVVDRQGASGSGSQAKDGGEHQQESGESIDFGDITFLMKKTCTLTIANTGSCAAHFSFVEKPSPGDGAEYGKQAQWLSTSFSREIDEASGESVDVSKEVSLEPGDTVTTSIEILVDDLSLVRQLNDGQHKLEDILVLRVKDGRDHFIPIRGTWTATCIGRSIDELIRIPDGGIRAFVKSEPNGKKISGSIPYDLDVRCAAPKELFKLTELLETLTERVLADENMLEDHKMPKDKAGWPFESPVSESMNEHVVKVIDTLDNDYPIASAFEPEDSAILRLEVVSRVLLLFLQGLTDGIVSIPLWSKIEQLTLKSKASHTDEAIEDDKATILDIMSSAPNHNISFVFLTTTLAKVISELCPISKAEAESLKASGRGVGSLGRRSLSFRKSGGNSTAEAVAALERREAKEKRFAELFGRAVCRYPPPAKDKERKALEEKERVILELFLKRVCED